VVLGWSGGSRRHRGRLVRRLSPRESASVFGLVVSSAVRGYRWQDVAESEQR
jgi:hypothetical protein